jgi:2-polyprenyl-3-methyl-5-hydroxy-6-metoxy-1,4-benzoquinol methylase
LRGGADPVKRARYYSQPPREAFSAMPGGEYTPGYKTYAEYNYLGSGIASAFKSRHFEVALALTKDHFHQCNVIDFGCADGVFLPSLSKHFNHVLAVDKNAQFVEVAQKLTEALHLDNVEVRLNNGAFSQDLRPAPSLHYHIIFLLEILEHVGSSEAFYESKMDFLKSTASLLDEDGLMVISVPKMIGIPFLFQRLGLSILRARRERISLGNLLKAGLLRDTENLENNWQECDHLGFNHDKLEHHLGRNFIIVEKRSLLFQMVYMVKMKKPT